MEDPNKREFTEEEKKGAVQEFVKEQVDQLQGKPRRKYRGVDPIVGRAKLEMALQAEVVAGFQGDPSTLPARDREAIEAARAKRERRRNR